jgi:predicted secreted hydrolase
MPSSARIAAALLAALAATASTAGATAGGSAGSGRGDTAAGPSAPWKAAAPGHVWSFPRDHASHPGYRNEWWYLTGTLQAEGDPGTRLGWQVTFFRVGLAVDRPAPGSAWGATDVLMGHAAVTDLASGRHLFSEVLYRAVPLLAGFGGPADPLLAWSRGPPGTAERWELWREGDGFAVRVADARLGMALRLALHPARPPVLQGPEGLSRKSDREGFASLYYSVTRLRTAGTVTVGERTLEVRGESWLDREFGSSQLAPDQSGWDWFALRLADGRDLMLYLLRGKDGAPGFRSGTLVERDGTPRWLRADEFEVAATGRWRSPATGAEYPAGWRVRVPGAGLSLHVEPVVPDQENRGGSAPFYWEGVVRVTGSGGERAGEGYVELTGYGEGNRPPI